MERWIAEHPEACEALWYAFLAGMTAVLTFWVTMPFIDRMKQRAITAELAEQEERRLKGPWH